MAKKSLAKVGDSDSPAVSEYADDVDEGNEYASDDDASLFDGHALLPADAGNDAETDSSDEEVLVNNDDNS